MFQVKSVMTRLGLAVALFMAPATAVAQDVLVLDSARVLQESKAGQDMYAKIQQIGATMQSELEPEQQALQTEKQALDTKVRGKTREQIEAEPALVQQLEAYGRKLQTNAAKAEARSRELSQTENNALNAFREKVAEAAEKVRARKNGQIVLSKQVVFLSGDSVDITTEVITQLDQDTPTIAVTRVPSQALPQQSAPQQ